MMQVMNNVPFQFGGSSSEQSMDSFEDAIDKITFPNNPALQQLVTATEATSTSMRAVFINAFNEQDGDDAHSDDGETIVPRRFDIICGRDKISHSHVGNKRFRTIIEMNRERYQTAPSRDDKTRITFEIVSMIRSCQPGGRFLKIDDTAAWKDVGDEYAREKVSHALRSAKDPNRKKSRRKRKTFVKPHSDEENSVFAALLEDQQNIFQRLVAEEEGRQKKRPRRESFNSQQSWTYLCTYRYATHSTL